MMEVSVKADVKNALRVLSEQQRSAVPKAAARALNRTLDKANTTAARTISKESGIQQKQVRAGLTKVRASWRKLRVVLIARGKHLNLIRFTRMTREAARKAGGVRARPWGTQRFFEKMWIGNQGRTVFIRERGGGVRAAFGPSIGREMLRERSEEALQQTIRETWPTQFARELKWYLSKIK